MGSPCESWGPACWMVEVTALHLCCSSHRTESVAEKMLTNWFTFLLYKFLKVGLGPVSGGGLGCGGSQEGTEASSQVWCPSPATQTTWF